MSALAAGTTAPRRLGGRLRSRISRFWAAISAVSIKELRGRMRGRRAFVVLTIYLLLLALFAFGIFFYLKQQAATGAINVGTGVPTPDFPGFPGGVPFPGGQTLSNGTALSAGIGHGIFGGLLLIETLLVLVLAPAFTTGAISLEREKQTLDLLVTTPLSTMGMIIGKLFSALTYVFLLILASIPLASLVFVFGGVGPEDLVRAYVFLFALAFGMGAVGLFVSALVRRTQTATVFTFVLVLVFSIGTAAVHQFWQVASRQTSSSTLLTQRGKAPEALLWLNPFAADLDMVCATAPDAYHQSCEYISAVTGKPYFGSPTTPTNPVFPVERGGDGGVIIVDDFVMPDCPPNADCVAPEGGKGVPGDDPIAGSGVTNAVSFGFPRDTFWPKSATAFVVLGIVLTLLSAQLVSPTRRLRLPRLSRGARPQPPTATESAASTPSSETEQQTEAV